jgi:hypothetical protein
VPKPGRNVVAVWLRVDNLIDATVTVLVWSTGLWSRNRAVAARDQALRLCPSHAMLPDACSFQQRRAMTLTGPRFPILTLEEGSLMPSLGYLFDRNWLYPYESLISILWKFEKANALSGNVVAQLLGPDVDPYEGLVPRLSVIDIDRLRANLQVSRSSLRMALIQDEVRLRWSTSFRFCRLCPGFGYHSILHQFESLNVCPAHHTLWNRHVVAAATRYRIELTSNFSRRNITAPTVLHRTRMFTGRLPERGR